MIRSIVEQTGCKFDVEDDGSVKIFSSDGTAADPCIQMIADIRAVQTAAAELKSCRFAISVRRVRHAK